MKHSTRILRLAAAGWLLAAAAPVDAQFNDWKGAKLDAQLKRKHPPEYFVMGTAVKLEVKTQIPAGNNYTGLLRARLESGLFAQDSRLQAEERNYQTIISCEITRLDASDGQWETRTSKEYQKTGQRQEWNAKKARYETKDVWNYVQVTKRYKMVKGGVSLSYQARDARTRQTLDAHNIQPAFSNEYMDGNGAPSAHEVREMLIDLAVKELVKRLTPTTELLTVYLPRGKVENFSKLGQAGLWEKMREAVDKMDTLPKPADEAYRQFALGSANEALAYQAEQVTDSIKLFEEASINYNKALELKPDEKYFLSPIARLQQSLAQYKKLSSQQAAYAQARALQNQTANRGGERSLNPTPSNPKPTPATTPTPAPAPTPKASAALTNQKVVEMVAAELDDANIIATIKSAPAVQFDLTTDGVLDLKKNKVSNEVISVMRLRQDRSTTPRRPAATPRRKP
jgi:hypothetical protein